MNTVALALLIVLVSGCASTGTQPEAVEPDRIAPGRVAIVAATYAPQTSVHSNDTRGSMAGKQAAYRGLGGVGVGLLMPLYMGPIGILLYPVIAPFTVAIGAVGGGVVGAVEGAAKGMSASRLDPLHPAIERAVRQQKMPDAVAQSVMQQGAAFPHYEFTYVADAGPASATDRPDYQRLKAEGFDSVLELGVASVGFEASKGEPPSAVFEMKLNVRVVPLNGHGSAFVRELQHRGHWRGVPEWAADDGKLLEEEFNQSYGALALELCTAALWPVSAE
jgi:hypothetical protein